MRPINGQLSVVVAQAIIPDDELVLPDGHSHVLLTYKPITRTVVANIQEKLGLTKLSFIPAAAAIAGTNASQSIGKAGFKAVWQSQTPSNTIWQHALPLVAVLLVSVRYGRALSALQKKRTAKSLPRPP